MCYSNGHAMSQHRHSHDVTSERVPLLGNNGHPLNHAPSWPNGMGDSAAASTKRHRYDSDDTPCESDESERGGVSFEGEESKRRRGQSSQARPSLVRVLVRQFGGTIAVCLIQRLVADLGLIVSPLILG